ncbi:MAG: histidine-type phosphatase [Salinivirgaceae bacterium]|nr:histidine-type phosphatase [Salinivirgaceae bacterium]MBR3568970.1 histidine-type phosphatase [Salinivirgaceae bacterium]
MNRFTLTVIGVLCFATLQAQTTKEEMLANLKKTGGNNMVYQPEIKPQTPAPKGYKPFYISHYGRHGSRYHYSGFDYQMFQRMMKSANDANALTDAGKDLKNRVDRLCEDGINRAGDLTQTGFNQHQGIAERMVNSFPEVFADNANIVVKSSTSHRVLCSMDAFMQKMKAMRPTLNVTTESSKRIMHYINNEERDSVTRYLNRTDGFRKANDAIDHALIHPERLIKQVFSDTAYVRTKVNAHQFMRKLFDLQCNMQNIDDLDFDFSDFFTDDEMFDNWQVTNVYWYANFSNCPYSNSRGSWCARNLLTKILDEADAALAGNGVSANLRFGHDTGLAPLASLMQLEGTTAQVTDFAELYKVWCDFKIIPMGGNLQMIFYKSDKSKDVLVKVLLNENEVKLPIDSKTAPYYKWDEVEAYYRKVLSEIPLSVKK